MKYTEEDAWQAMDNYRPQDALNVWTRLIDSETNPEKALSLRSNSGYALLGLGQFEEARDLYKELFEETNSHRFLHQLCMVERDAENYDQALTYLNQERDLINKDDNFAIAINLYEFGKVNELQGNYEEALEYANKCHETSLKCDDLILLACANRLLGDILRYTDKGEAEEFYQQAQKLFINAGDDFAADEVEELIFQIMD